MSKPQQLNPAELAAIHGGIHEVRRQLEIARVFPNPHPVVPSQRPAHGWGDDKS